MPSQAPARNDQRRLRRRGEAPRRAGSSEPLNVYGIRLGVPPSSGLGLLASQHGASRTSKIESERNVETFGTSNLVSWLRLTPRFLAALHLDLFEQPVARVLCQKA